MSELRIEPAADHLDLVPTVAAWHWDGGGWRDPEGSLETWVDGLLGRTQRDRIPATFFAFVDGTLVGSATLVEHDMPDRGDLQHLRPWLAGVYVAAPARGRRIGTRLVGYAEDQARAFGVGRLFLYTERAAAFYRRLGWNTVGQDEFRGGAITVMFKDLG